MNFEEAQPFFERHHWSVVTTHQANGAAHSSIVVCGAYQGHAGFVSVYGKSAKVRNLRRDPRCGLLIDNPTTPYKRVSVQGEVEFLPGDFDWIPQARGMAERYLGLPGVAYAETTFGFPRVPFYVRAKKITTWNGEGFDRTFTADTTWHNAPRP